MKIISTTVARKELPRLIEVVKQGNQALRIGRRNRPEALLIKYPAYLNPRVSEMTNFNANSASFDFLAKEEDLYSVADLKRRYV